ncbi:MAG TPA: hypothetical protein VN081_02950 [Dongiaceae bacterium]|nr:hypothetical protein [Dongiaceae bacterium]
MLRAGWEEDTLAKVHALRPLLRGVKTTGFLLAVVSFASVAALQQSRPVGAESFLFQTVQCVVGAVLGDTCPQSSGSTGQEATVTSSSRSASSNGSSGNGGQGQGNGKTSSAPTAGSQPSTGGAGSFATPPIDPAEMQNKALNNYAALPDTPAAITDGMQQFQGASQQVFPYGLRSAASTDTGPASFINPSGEGWQVMGVAWYWWVSGIAAIAAIMWAMTAAAVRRYQYKFAIILSNREDETTKQNQTASEKSLYTPQG